MTALRKRISIVGLGLKDIAIAATTIGLVHAAGFFIKFPAEILLFLGPDFFVWFFFHFYLALGLSLFLARLFSIFFPFALLGVMTAIGIIVIVFSNEKLKWMRAVLIYPKRVNYLDWTYNSIGYIAAIYFSNSMFGSIYLDSQFLNFIFLVLVLSIIFFIFFFNTSLRSPKRTLRQLRRLGNFQKSVWAKRFSRNLVIVLFLLAAFSAGLFRFEHLADLDDLTMSAGGRSEAVGLVGFVGTNPIVTTRDGDCRQFFVDVSETIFSSRRCPASSD